VCCNGSYVTLSSVSERARRPEQPHATEEALTSGTRWRPGRRRSSTSDATSGRLSAGRPRIREPEGRDAVGQPTAAFVGIDVSKASRDACLLLPAGKARQAAFANDAGGHAALIAWADRHAAGCDLRFCLEATGPYSEAPALALAEAGRHVSVANPARV